MIIAKYTLFTWWIFIDEWILINKLNAKTCIEMRYCSTILFSSLWREYVYSVWGDQKKKKVEVLMWWKQSSCETFTNVMGHLSIFVSQISLHYKISVMFIENCKKCHWIQHRKLSIKVIENRKVKNSKVVNKIIGML